MGPCWPVPLINCSSSKNQTCWRPCVCLPSLALRYFHILPVSLHWVGLSPLLTGNKPFTAHAIGEKSVFLPRLVVRLLVRVSYLSNFFHGIACCDSIQPSLYNWLLGALPWTGYSCWRRAVHLLKPTVVSPSSPWQVQTRNHSKGWGQEGLLCLARNSSGIYMRIADALLKVNKYGIKAYLAIQVAPIVPIMMMSPGMYLVTR